MQGNMHNSLCNITPRLKHCDHSSNNYSHKKSIPPWRCSALQDLCVSRVTRVRSTHLQSIGAGEGKRFPAPSPLPLAFQVTSSAGRRDSQGNCLRHWRDASKPVGGSIPSEASRSGGTTSDSWAEKAFRGKIGWSCISCLYFMPPSHHLLPPERGSVELFYFILTLRFSVLLHLSFPDLSEGQSPCHLRCMVSLLGWPCSKPCFP